MIASLVAYLVGEFSNSVVLARMSTDQGALALVAHHRQHADRRRRGQPDLHPGRHAGGRFPWELFGSLVLTNYIFKTSIEVVMTPLTYRIVNALKRGKRRLFLTPTRASIRLAK